MYIYTYAYIIYIYICVALYEKQSEVAERNSR